MGAGCSEVQPGEKSGTVFGLPGLPCIQNPSKWGISRCRGVAGGVGAGWWHYGRFELVMVLHYQIGLFSPLTQFNTCMDSFLSISPDF